LKEKIRKTEALFTLISLLCRFRESEFDARNHQIILPEHFYTINLRTGDDMRMYDILASVMLGEKTAM